MANPKSSFRRIDTEEAFFQQALNFTAEKLGFNTVLIEKDYYCPLVLAYLYSTIDDILIFKGRTALNKVHVGFYRLSEDLDFSISMPSESTRSQRSKAAEPIKKIFSELPGVLPGLTTSTPISGRNNSLQYIGEVEYQSRFSASPGVIQVEVGLREPNLLPTCRVNAKTALLSPADEKPLLEPFLVRAYHARETIVEKFRAALCRREAAIRDFFDIYYLVAKTHVSVDDTEMIELVKRKLAVPGNQFLGVTPSRIEALKQQLETELRPVLQEEVFNTFNLDDSLNLVRRMQERIQTE